MELPAMTTTERLQRQRFAFKPMETWNYMPCLNVLSSIIDIIEQKIPGIRDAFTKGQTPGGDTFELIVNPWPVDALVITTRPALHTAWKAYNITSIISAQYILSGKAIGVTVGNNGYPIACQDGQTRYPVLEKQAGKQELLVHPQNKPIVLCYGRQASVDITQAYMVAIKAHRDLGGRTVRALTESMRA